MKKLISILSCAFFAFACGDSSEDNTLFVLTSPDNPPFEFKDTAKGGDKVIGFDMDLAHLIGEELGRPVHIVELDFGGLIPALQSGRGDMILAALAPTDDRRKSVDFSIPYYENTFVLLTPKGSDVRSEKDLSHKKLGVQLGSSHEQLAQNLAEGAPWMEIYSLNRIGEIVQELKNGRLDAILIEEITARNIAKKNPQFEVHVLDIEGEKPAAVLMKGAPLLPDVNKAIQILKDNGALESLEQKWFRG